MLMFLDYLFLRFEAHLAVLLISSSSGTITCSWPVVVLPLVFTRVHNENQTR